MRSRSDALRRAAAMWLATALVAFAAADPAARAVARRLDTVLDQVPRGTTAAVVVADVATGEQWYARAADTPVKPASVMKLFVTAAALERFGPSFAYETRVYVHEDQLWVVGSGDPGLGDPRLASRNGVSVEGLYDRWAQALRERGQSTLGKIVLDDSIFDEQGRHPDWPDDQADRWYQAPVGGLNLNDNCLDVTVKVDGGQVRLELTPPLPDALLDNALRVGKQQRPIVRRPIAQDRFELAGSVTRSGNLDPVAAGRPTVFFGYATHAGLERRGIDVRGAVVRRALRTADLEGATLVARHVTPLPEVVWRCNNFSQNLFAECLFKSLSAYQPDGDRAGTAGSWDGGRRVLRETLTSLGCPLGGARFRDGSGLSHSNRVTARQVVELLRIMRKHPHGHIFMESLAEPGQAGSMRRRYADPLLRGRLHGKTGTISGVRCIAGYLERDDGHTLAFAVLLNGKPKRSHIVEACKALVE